MSTVFARARAAPLKLLLLFAITIVVAGCALRPEIQNIEDAIAVTSADITSVATQIKSMCGNTEPDGECLPGALIDTDTKLELKMRLQDAQDQLVLANMAVNVRDDFEADDRLGQAEGILRLLRHELARRENQ